MWSTFLENPETLNAIYHSELPSLQQVDLLEIGFINGIDINVI